MSYTLKDGSVVDDPRLGRVKPADWEHYDKFPLTAAMAATVTSPGIVGFNWYSSFDTPVGDGRWYWIGKDTNNLGWVRGGHCFCLRPFNWIDLIGWWDFYNQGAEGACVGFGTSRAMSLINRKRYNARDLYFEAQKIDTWPGGAYPGGDPFYEGTEVRAGLEVVRSKGLERVYDGRTYPWDAQEGISAYRWARTWDEVRAALSLPDSIDGVAFFNSWGRDYPHIVRMTDECGELLLGQEGEVAFVTDR